MENIISAVTRLLQVLIKLNGPDGCPWDKKQTNRSLCEALIEETYEAIEAIDADDPDLIREELGDLLFLTLFHCMVAERDNICSCTSIINGVREKLVRRHPHVFADTKVSSVSEVLQNWTAIKAEEKSAPHKKTLLQGIPASLPSLQRTYRIIDKLNRLTGEKTEKDTAANAGKLVARLYDRIDDREFIRTLAQVLETLVRLSYSRHIKPEDVLREHNTNLIKKEVGE